MEAKYWGESKEGIGCLIMLQKRKRWELSRKVVFWLKRNRNEANYILWYICLVEGTRKGYGCREAREREILCCFSCIPENLDYYVSEALRGCFLSAYISTKDMWMGMWWWGRGAVSFFTDVSKLGEKVGGMFFVRSCQYILALDYRILIGS